MVSQTPLAAELRGDLRRLRDDVVLPLQRKTGELEEQVTKCLVFALRELKATEGPVRGRPVRRVCDFCLA
jgi:hypothetical protein